MDYKSLEKSQKILESRIHLLNYSNDHTMIELLTETLNELERLTNSKIGFYHFLESDQQTLKLQTWSTSTRKFFCEIEASGKHYDLSDAGIWADCVREKKAIIHNDYSKIENKRGLPNGHAKIIREIVIPVFRKDKIVSVLGVGNKETEYDNDDLDIVNQLADLAWDITERKRIEETLIEKELNSRYLAENLINTANVIVVSIDVNGIIEIFNKTAEKITGYSKEEVIGKNWFDIFTPIDKLYFVWEEFKRQLSTTQENKNFENPIFTKNGSVRHILWQSNNIIKNGEVVGLVSFGMDITNTKETVRDYKSLLYAIPDMMARIRYDGHILDIKPGEGIFSEHDDGQSVAYIDFKLDDLPFGEVVINEFKRVVKEVIDKNDPIEFTYTLKINGTDRHYYSRTVKNGDNEVVTIVRDVTEERNLSKELLNSKEFAENLLNTANVMIVGLDIKGNVKIFNNAAEKLTGYSKNEIIGKNWFKDVPILPKEEIQKLNLVFENLISDDESNNTYENPIITKYGEIKHILWQNNEIRENNEIVGTLSFGLDITERNIYERELITAKEKAEESDKLKLEFLANMSHDLRTPMNSIIGFSDLLKGNNLTKNERNDYINTIIENGKFLIALIDDIIDISKIDAGALKIEKNDFELNKLMEDIRMTFFKNVKDKGLDIILDIDINKNIILNSDKYRMRQILTNLISNSIKFTKNGYIKFGYNIINDEKIMIYVEDTGIGIDKPNQKIIFNKFKQLNESGNKFKGAGLGLAIVKSLVDLLGYKEVRVISELNKGSKFYFYTPYSIKHFNYMNELKNKNKNKNKRINLSGKKILIIEDDMDSVIIIRSHLAETHAEIIYCNDGNEDIVNIIKNKHVDLVLLDIGLPGRSGYDILQDIRKYDERLPIIIESAVVMIDQKNKAYNLGCSDFLSKPFSREDFLNKIDNWI